MVTFGEVQHDILKASSQLANVQMPLPLVRPAAATLVFYESYSVGGGVTTAPSEWVPEEADDLLVVEDTGDIKSVWMAAAKKT